MAIQRMAVVDAENNVVNVIVYDTEGNWTPPEGCILVDAETGGGVGETWDGEELLPVLGPEVKKHWWSAG